ncbi:MAG: (2Fe-2S)-binding protein [Peptococcaceae bacterium]|nr:(2Fe-2S)-binding protein [Peptococcaceae bacterium]
MKETYICRCQEVTVAMVEQAIAEGADTVDGVKKRTRAGMGLCQGKTCSRLVEKKIAELTGKAPQEILPAAHRAPVRPISLGVVEGDADEK